jgi:hypothetical protein
VIALPIGVAALGLLIAAFAYSRKKHPEWFAGKKQDKRKKTNKKPKKAPTNSNLEMSDISMANSSSTSPIVADDLNPTNPPKKFTVNIDYLMTGARRGVINILFIIFIIGFLYIFLFYFHYLFYLNP